VANLLEFTKALFGSDKIWDKITDEDKISHFFIVNRMFSKKYPFFSQMSNSKYSDKRSSMDIFHQLVKDTGFNQWFWSKSPQKNNKNENIKDDDGSIFPDGDYTTREKEVIKRFYTDKIEKK